MSNTPPFVTPFAQPNIKQISKPITIPRLGSNNLRQSVGYHERRDNSFDAHRQRSQFSEHPTSWGFMKREVVDEYYKHITTAPPNSPEYVPNSDEEEMREEFERSELVSSSRLKVFKDIETEEEYHRGLERWRDEYDYENSMDGITTDEDEPSDIEEIQDEEIEHFYHPRDEFLDDEDKQPFKIQKLL